MRGVHVAKDGDELMHAANVLQRRWCAQLLHRAPPKLATMRTNIAQTLSWLEQHPHRVLFRSYHERLVRYGRLLDDHGVPLSPPAVKMTKQKNQLALDIESRKADRT